MKRVCLVVLALAVGLAILVLAFEVGLVRFGDPIENRYALVRNNTRVPVEVHGRSGRVEWTVGRLAAVDSIPMAWLVTSERTISAWDERGTMVFCRAYDNEQLDRLGWTIDIVSGDIQCSESRP